MTPEEVYVHFGRGLCSALSTAQPQDHGRTEVVTRVCLPPSASCLAIEETEAGLCPWVPAMPASQMAHFETLDMVSASLKTPNCCSQWRKSSVGVLDRDSHATKLLSHLLKHIDGSWWRALRKGS